MSENNSILVDHSLTGIERALERAAQNALSLARQTNTPCIVAINGEMMDLTKLTPEELTELKANYSTAFTSGKNAPLS